MPPTDRSNMAGNQFANVWGYPFVSLYPNAFNGRDILCRTVMRGEQADIRYGLLLADTQTEGDLRDHVAVWQRCLGAIAGLANDPEGFLGAP